MGNTRVILKPRKKNKRALWPFGYNGSKSKVDSVLIKDLDGNICGAKWNCPGCGKKVKMILNAVDKKKLPWQPGGVSGHIDKYTYGEYNQLCEECNSEYG